jgi:hypothetical protein
LEENMTNQERDRARELQDKVIAEKITKRFVADMGGDYPLFGEGTPTYNQICACVYTDMIDRMESFLTQLYRAREANN